MQPTNNPKRWLSRHRLKIILVFVVAVSSFGTGIRWGLPEAANPETVQSWALDTVAPIAPLNEAYYGFTRSGNEYVVYPLFHYIVLSVAYAPYVGVQFLSGNIAEPGSTFPYGLQDVAQACQDLTLIARLVSLAMALGIVALIYRITETVAGRDAAVWAALAVSLIAPLSYYAKTSNLDVPYAFWVCLAAWRFLCILDQQKYRDYVLFAVFSALAVATKDQAYGFFVLIPLVLAYALARSRQPVGRVTLRQWSAALVSRPMLLGGVAALVSYAAANNIFLGGLDGLLRHLSYGGDIYDYRQNTETAFYSLRSQIQLLGQSGVILLQTLAPLSVGLALFGIVCAVRERMWNLLSLLAFVVSYYIFVIAVFNMVFARYLLVPAILLTPFIGVGITRLATTNMRSRAISTSLVALSLLSQSALVVDLNLTLVADSRQTMGDWIHANVEQGAVIESQVRARMLPHISADYKVSIAGNSGDPITMLVVPEDLTPAALTARNPDYVLILEGLGVTGDPEGWDSPSLMAYYQDLIDGLLGYEKIAEFTTPHFVPFRQIPGTRPTSILLARSATIDE